MGEWVYRRCASLIAKHASPGTRTERYDCTAETSGIALTKYRSASLFIVIAHTLVAGTISSKESG
ncbi:hypothetical protein BN2476_110150 [Paraburkholderia piptadeniae]|uniref:Uncharacterized protein n=1 Tax=Paraburkholderia piptadeniae TaxID=1701573 RepID=A0A1N7RPX9_9BURK|nr:hypothetical protein BN2476_110150 [Paraburkholderia piptadeniae]